jgi:hypothetical protein
MAPVVLANHSIPYPELSMTSPNFSIVAHHNLLQGGSDFNQCDCQSEEGNSMHA